VAKIGDAVSKTALDQIGEDFPCLSEVWVCCQVSHDIATLNVERSLVVQNKLEKNLDHAPMDQVGHHLEVSLGKVAQEQEELLEVLPVYFCTVNEFFDKHLNKSD
jgi:hypothetical protein